MGNDVVDMSETTTKGTLLIVDDVAANVSVLFESLSQAGFKVLVAQDGKRAIQKAEYAKPDLILLDVMMPGIDGFEACRILKSKENTKEIPIIFMTALADTVDKVKGFSLGAADYITKPIQYEEVLARVMTQLNFRQLQKQLQLHTKELEKRNLELKAFSRTVAHDLKNPLNIIVGYAEVMLSECNPGKVIIPELLEYTQAIVQASHKMIKINDALLLLAGVSQQTQIIHEPVNMLKILDQVIQQRISPMLKDYQGKISFSQEAWPTVLGYTPWIEEIWVNYLTNGLKYGGQPPHLIIGAEQLDNNMVSFWVQDNGPGLSPEAQQQLFTPFTRLHRDRAEGHGLGLSIVQQIVEKLGGQAGVKTTLGEGCSFFFTLPLAKSRH